MSATRKLLSEEKDAFDTIEFWAHQLARRAQELKSVSSAKDAKKTEDALGSICEVLVAIASSLKVGSDTTDYLLRARDDFFGMNLADRVQALTPEPAKAAAPAKSKPKRPNWNKIKAASREREFYER